MSAELADAGDAGACQAKSIESSQQSTPKLPQRATHLLATVSNSIDSNGHLSVRLQGIEVLTTPSGTLYYSWGMNDYNSGFIHVADLTLRPVIDEGARAGNGHACDIRPAVNGDRKAYYVRPRAIPGGLKYRGPSTGKLHSMTHYGTPGAPAHPDYTYLSWSWINKAGGGLVRSVVRDGEVFYPCAVASIKSTSLLDQVGFESSMG